MNVESIQVDSIKNERCATTIKNTLAEVPGVTNVAVHPKLAKVTVVYECGNLRPLLLQLLHNLGYHEKMISNPFSATLAI